MISLAAKMLRRRVGSAVATLLALVVGVAILTAMGLLMESGIRYRPQPQQYGGADVVVAHRKITIVTKTLDDTEKTDWALPDGGTVPAELTEKIRSVRGVSTVVADDTAPVVGPAGAAVTGHAWDSAVLRPYALVTGGAPAGDDDVVLDSRLSAGQKTGSTVKLLVNGRLQQFRVSGFARGDGPESVFFSDRRAAQLAGHPGRHDVIGVRTQPGADVGAIEKLAAGAGVEAYAGQDRGKAEATDADQTKELLIALGGSFGGYVLMLVMFVVAGTIGLSVRHRRRDLALLRAIAATPGQVRRMIVAEAGLISLVAVAAGVPLGLLSARWLHGELVDRGFVAASFPMAPGAFGALIAAGTTVLIAMLSALIAARRVTRIRPTEALGEAAAEPTKGGIVRLIFGLLTLAGASTAATLTVGTGGQSALSAAAGMLYLFVTAVALLAPWINAFAARLLTPALRAFWGSGGYLAGKNLTANAKGMTTVLTSLVLSVGFGGSVWFLQDNLERVTIDQTRAGTVASQVLMSPAGLPAQAVADARTIHGVTAVTGIRHTKVSTMMLGDPEEVQAEAVDGVQAIDPGVRSGSLADLRGDTVAVSSSEGKSVGDKVPFWLPDGSAVTLRVVAVYDRELGFGDVLLPMELAKSRTVDQVLISAPAGTSLASLTARYPGSALVATSDLNAKIADDMALNAWLNKLLIGVMVGYAALAAANTMVMAALARRRELSLLRLVGVTRRQVKNMVNAEQVGLLGVALVIGSAIAVATLAAIVNALTGSPTPYIPVLGAVAVLGGAAVLALTTTVLPIGRLLRVPAVESIGIKE